MLLMPPQFAALKTLASSPARLGARHPGDGEGPGHVPMDQIEFNVQ